MITEKYIKAFELFVNEQFTSEKYLLFTESENYIYGLYPGFSFMTEGYELVVLYKRTEVNSNVYILCDKDNYGYNGYYLDWSKLFRVFLKECEYYQMSYDVMFKEVYDHITTNDKFKTVMLLE